MLGQSSIADALNGGGALPPFETGQPKSSPSKSIAGNLQLIGPSSKNKEVNKASVNSAIASGAIPQTQLMMKDNIGAHKELISAQQNAAKAKDDLEKYQIIFDKLGTQDPNFLLSEEGANLVRQYFPNLSNEDYTQKFIPYIYKRQNIINQLQTVPMGTTFSEDQLKSMGQLGISNPSKYMNLFGSILGSAAKGLKTAIKGQAQTSSELSNPLSPLKAGFDLQDKQALDEQKSENLLGNKLQIIGAQTQGNQELAGYKSILDDIKSTKAFGNSLVLQKQKTMDNLARIEKAALYKAKSGSNAGADPKFILRLREQFQNDKTIKNGEEIINSWDKMNGVWNSYADTLAKGQGSENTRLGVHQALIILFNKMLDPGSVVKTDEYNRTPEGQAAINKVEGYMSKFKEGGSGLTDADLQGILSVAKDLMKAGQHNYQNKINFYESEANKSGISDSSRITGGRSISRDQLTPQSPQTPPLKVGDTVGRFKVKGISK